MLSSQDDLYLKTAVAWNTKLAGVKLVELTKTTRLWRVFCAAASPQVSVKPLQTFKEG